MLVVSCTAASTQADAEMHAIGAAGEATILTLGFDKAGAQICVCCKLSLMVFDCGGVHAQEPSTHTHTPTGIGLTIERLLEKVAGHCTPPRQLDDQLVFRPWPRHGAPGPCSLACSVVGSAAFSAIAV